MSRTTRRQTPRGDGFTLVELILVMGLLAGVMAVAAPLLSRSLRDRHLQHEALRVLGLLELSRSTAISAGVPMLFWVDAGTGRFGMEPKAGFEAEESAMRDYGLGGDVWFDEVTQARGQTAETTIEFAPDGTPEGSPLETVRLADRYGSTITLVRAEDGWGYEIEKLEEPAP